MNKKTESITVRITKEEREKLNRIVELKKSKNVNQIVQEALDTYYKSEVVNDQDLLSNWKLDERKKVDFRYGNKLNFLTEDVLEIRENEIRKIILKYENNRSKKNVATIVGHFVRILYAQQKYDEYVEKEKKEKELREADLLERKEQLRARIRASIETSEEEGN